jgi:predicted RNA-binding protein with PUA-like domain
MGVVKQGSIVHIAVDPRKKYYDPKNEQDKSSQCLIGVRYKQERQCLIDIRYKQKRQ